MSTGPDDLFEKAADYLNACLEGVEQSPGGLIERSYVSPGPPVLDTEQVTVHVVADAEGDTAPLQPVLAPGSRDRLSGAVHMIALMCTVVRFIPVYEAETADLPTSDSLTRASRVVYGDLWSITNTCRRRRQSKELFDGVTWAFFDPATYLTTPGGLAGWMIPVRINLDGYELS